MFDPSAEKSAQRGIHLAEGLGAATAADIAGVQQVLVRKLAKEYLKLRFHDGLKVEQTIARDLSPETPGACSAAAFSGSD